ncbi:hypothetical protein P170DRAFT_472377 [Aspergillus steynii IBT 23096]|uniref:Uncharacterized protein n=1 Tax=Aspergillus steynii IBT 23096 TaxID=1392250 RepID=A0A2I2GI19_9EURO|nr:uncharacterized protein P170DRAFT_472377 [Aspergillus steynii IBT 23096]PLB52487.1 hypothetical protein P170DRAFT_472377 [Aspergillus steynii IBT 23096]
MGNRDAESPARPAVNKECNTDNDPTPSAAQSECYQIEIGRDGDQRRVYDNDLEKTGQKIREFNKKLFGVEDDLWVEPWTFHEAGIEYTGVYVPRPKPKLEENPFHKHPFFYRTVGWSTVEADKSKKLAGHISYGIAHWARNYCVEDPETIEEEFSSEEKEELIRSLAGYCKQQSWDSLVEQMKPCTYRDLPQILAEAILAKSIWENVVKDPFFFLGENCDPVPPGGYPDLFLPSRSQIHNMWRWAEQVTSYDACKWRRLTLQHLIENTPAMSKNPSLGIHVQKFREAAIERMAEEILSPTGTLRRFLKKPSDPEDEKWTLWTIIRLYRQAEQLSYGLHVHDNQYNFYPLELLPMFEPDTENMERSWPHNAERGSNDQRTSRPVLFQFRPILTYTSEADNGKKSTESNLIWPAEVVISSHSKTVTNLWSLGAN